MSRRLVLSSQAEIDLVEARLWAARTSVRTADRTAERLDEACRLLCTHGEMGEATELSEPPTRMFSVGAFVIFYRASDEELHVLRVLHGSREEVDRMRRRESGA